MIVVALDSSSPTSRSDLSWGAWVGNGRNRWYDKHQRTYFPRKRKLSYSRRVPIVVVWDNGRSAFLGEHASMDGTPTLRLNEFILGSLAAKEIDLGSPSPSSSLLTPPSEIVLTANDTVLADVKEAEKNFDKLVGSHDLQVLHYDAYGKNLIKQFKTSPDAWAQLVKQLAFYKFKGRPAVTYESAQTRKFQLGRTEVIRAASEQSKAWVDAMVDSNATVRSIHFFCLCATCLLDESTIGCTTRRAIPQCCFTPCSVRCMGRRRPGRRQTSVWAQEDAQGRRGTS
jgi:carnitine O-acetyltransferase